MKKIFLYILLLTTLSCYSPNSQILVLDPRTFIENKVTLTDIVDDINYIPLDNKFPFENTQRFKIINKSIYVIVKDFGLVVFDQDGKNPRRIGKEGRGPGEYLICASFAVDKTIGTIYIRDLGSIIKVYSKSGTFLRNISLEKYGSSFDDLEILDSKLFISEYVSFGKAKFNWIILDTMNNLIGQKVNSIPVFQSRMGGNGGIYLFNEKLSYWNNYNDTVFSISDDLSYKTSFVFSTGEFRIPRSEISPQQRSELFNPIFLFETHRFLVFKYFFGKTQIVLIDKTNKKTFLNNIDVEVEGFKVFEKGGIQNDIDAGPAFRSIGYMVEKNCEYLVGTVDAYQLKAIVASEAFKNSSPSYPDKKKELEKLADGLKDTDNQVLMLVRLKK